MVKKITTHVTKTEEDVVDLGEYVSAYISGFNKAVDVMYPLVVKAIERTQGNVYDMAIEDTLKNLEPTIKNRVKKELEIKGASKKNN